MAHLSGQTAFITGAASGIGRALAANLARRGVHLILTDIDAQGLDASAEEARACGVRVHTYPLDVADRAAVFALAQQVGPVDIVVNNAGVALSQTVADLDIEDFRWIVDINFWGVVHGTQAFLPAMLQRGQGHIVNISSVFGIIGVPTQAAYNATKFAVRGFTEALRQEVEGSGVRVCCVHPGGIRTHIARNSRHYVSFDGSTDADDAARSFDSIARTSPQEAAEAIAAGIEADQRRVLIGGDARAIDLLQRLLPTRYDGAVRTFAHTGPRLLRAARRTSAQSLTLAQRALNAALRTSSRLAPLTPPTRAGRTLDPQVHLLLTSMRALGMKPAGPDASPGEARRAFVDQMRLLYQPAPPLAQVQNLQVQGAQGPLRARLYRPHDLPTAAPGVVFFHGGGFVIGDLDTHDPALRLLAARLQAVVVSVEYRLAPEHPFPAAWEDVTAAFTDLHRRAHDLGLLPERLAVAGDSAGGNLAAWVARAGRDGRCPRPCAQLLIYPVTDSRGGAASRQLFATGFILERHRVDWFSNHTLRPDQYDDVRASPLLDPDPSGLPPAVVVTAGFDPLVDEGDAYADLLQRAGVPTKHMRFDGLVHGFMHFFATWEAADDAVQAMCDALRAAMEPSQATRT